MKIKLVFIIVIVLATACSRKTLQSKDYSYYKQEMEKYKRDTGKDDSTENSEVNVATKPVVTTFLSPKEKSRFAEILEVDQAQLKNEKLYAAINEWLGTPYDWGGESKNGIDCSAYVQTIYKNVYGNFLPRTSIEQFYLDTESHFRDQKYLKEGDLVFFRLRHEDKVVSHVGIYLQNGKFTGSNAPKGVEIVDMNEPYWRNRYVASARLISNQ